jgi:hypothetical protein
VGDRSVSLAWSPQSGEEDQPPTGFNIYRSQDPQAPPTSYTLVGYSEDAHYTDSGLNAGCEYTYRVAPADRHNGQGDTSEPLTVRTDLTRRTTPPAVLAEMGVIPMGIGRIVVYWRRSPEPDVAVYHVHRSTTPDFQPTDQTHLALVPADGSWYQVYDDRDVTAQAAWYYRVQPQDYAGYIQTDSPCVSGQPAQPARVSPAGEHRHTPAGERS